MTVAQIAREGAHTLCILFQPFELALIAQGHARFMLTYRSGEQGVEPQLRTALATLGALRRDRLIAHAGVRKQLEQMPAETRAKHLIDRIVGRKTAGTYPIGNAPVTAELHGAHRHQPHFRQTHDAIGALDQNAVDAALGQIHGATQTHRATAHDEDGGFETFR